MEYTTVSHAGVSAFRRRLIRCMAGRRLERAGRPHPSRPDCGRFRGIAQRVCDRQRRNSRGTPQHVARSSLRPFLGFAVQHPPDDGPLHPSDSVRGHRHRTAADETPDLSRFRDYLAASGGVLRASSRSAAIRIGDDWYSDGGLLGALPLWAAAELGAKRMVGLQALPQSPSWWLHQFVRAFRGVAGHNPPVPPGIEVLEIRPGRPLGSVRDTIQWKRSNIERWLDQGAEDAV